MENRYTAAKCCTEAPANEYAGLGWCVQEMHSDSKSSWIKCYCVSETTAWEIALALNHMNAITDENWRTRT